jgi:hypothetical protein
MGCSFRMARIYRGKGQRESHETGNAARAWHDVGHIAGRGRCRDDRDRRHPHRRIRRSAYRAYSGNESAMLHAALGQWPGGPDVADAAAVGRRPCRAGRRISPRPSWSAITARRWPMIRAGGAPIRRVTARRWRGGWPPGGLGFPQRGCAPGRRGRAACAVLSLAGSLPDPGFANSGHRGRAAQCGAYGRTSPSHPRADRSGGKRRP